MHEKKTNKKTQTKSAIVVMNHRTRLDWLFYFCILYRLDALSNIKIILKDGLKKIPGAGWAMQTALFIFIKRKWEVDKEIFTKFINYYKQIEKKAYVN
jgi:lysocardiolipin and lysophospholipid acyltransferase